MYETSRGFVVSYFGAALSNRALPGLEVVSGLSCDVLASPTSTYPPGTSEPIKELVKYLRTLPTECVDYNLDWLDLGRTAGG